MLSLLAATVLVTVQPSPPAANAADSSAAAAVIAAAKSHLGAPYRWGTQGPWSFDCSGLVLRSFAEVGLVSKLGGWQDRSAYAIYDYFRHRGLASGGGGQPGDLVVWGGGAHVGIYLGHGMAISALVSGVQIHSIYALTLSFTAFLHTGLSGFASAPVKEASAIGSPRTVSAPRASTPTSVRHAAVRLMIRRGPSTRYGSLGVLASGTRLVVIGRATDSSHRSWDRVRTAGGQTGWVAAWLTRT